MKYIKKLSLFSIKLNNNIFINVKEDIIITLYINNILIIDRSKIAIQRIKNKLNIKFYILDLELYIYYLDITVKRDYRSNIIYLR